ncbi:MAG: hemerythrin family protein [Gammaproteobacteria bacterium]|nr:hemerythrin family protein [Gammaproteobacteria bacterium]
MKNRKIGQKISLFFSITCYLMALVTIVFGAYWWATYGTSNPIFASAIASVIFFISCGVVLQVIANANLPDLKIKSEST